jgi:hypothetical protein
MGGEAIRRKEEVRCKIEDVRRKNEERKLSECDRPHGRLPLYAEQRPLLVLGCFLGRYVSRCIVSAI